MKPDGEERPFTLHPLESSGEFDLGDRESVSQVKRTVGVRVGVFPNDPEDGWTENINMQSPSLNGKRREE